VLLGLAAVVVGRVPQLVLWEILAPMLRAARAIFQALAGLRRMGQALKIHFLVAAAAAELARRGWLLLEAASSLELLAAVLAVDLTLAARR
jgi:hypothetical protein